jgi:hypothetical protein
MYARDRHGGSDTIMGIIDGTEPKAIETGDWSPRVIVKVRDEARGVRSRGGRVPPGERGAREPVDAVRYLADVLRGRADVGGREAALEPLVTEADDVGRGRRDRFASYAAIRTADSAGAAALAEELDARDDIETAYVEGGPTPPPVDATDDPRSPDQGYLDAAPEGIDARWAWDHTDGAGIGFVDLEQGWTLNHEDLAAAGITIISGVSQAYHGHGTAVLGEVVAVDNARGGIGIAPEASARVVSQYRTTTTYSTAQAIISAADAMSPGDVLLLEAQTTVGGSTYLPVEVEQAVFDAIRDAVDAGIVVVEAAGNGSNDLDDFTNSAGEHVLRRGDSDFRDSGAIMVGAASSGAPHTRLSFSNFGSRIDCYAWGQGIDTTGDGWTGISTTAYTGSFGGTSGASPIVTGAAVLLQSWQLAREGHALSPAAVRTWLSADLNTPSDDPDVDRIGVMPNLRAIFEAIIANDRFTPYIDEYVLWVYILFGVINDAPGLIWVPGKGPVPIDPEWRTIAKQQHALLVDSLESKLRTGDRLSSSQFGTAAAQSLQGAVKQIGAQARRGVVR